MVRTTEEKLFGTLELYRIIVDVAEEGIWVADKEDRVTFTNNKIIDLLGYTQDELTGKKIFDFTDEKNRALMKESIERSRRGERGTYPLSLRNKGGKFILLLVSTTPMQDETGNYIGTVQLCSDMSSQKTIEDELREARARADMYLDLLSHDIRNVDQIVTGYLELLINKLEAGESLTRLNRDLIDEPLNALRASTDLIDTIKNLQKVKSARLPLEKIDLGEVVSSTMQGFVSVPGRLVKFHYSPVKDRWIEANYLLKEIFINLIGNAIKHSHGSLDIYIKIDEVERERERIKYYSVTVEDNGPGIPDTRKRQMFSPSSCEGAEMSGSGLGLCLIKSLVERFHGMVRVEDRVPGDHTKGARFVVMLPAVEQ